MAKLLFLFVLAFVAYVAAYPSPHNSVIQSLPGRVKRAPSPSPQFYGVDHIHPGPGHYGGSHYGFPNHGEYYDEANYGGGHYGGGHYGGGHYGGHYDLHCPYGHNGPCHEDFHHHH